MNFMLRMFLYRLSINRTLSLDKSGVKELQILYVFLETST